MDVTDCVGRPFVERLEVGVGVGTKGKSASRKKGSERGKLSSEGVTRFPAETSRQH